MFLYFLYSFSIYSNSGNNDQPSNTTQFKRSCQQTIIIKCSLIEKKLCPSFSLTNVRLHLNLLFYSIKEEIVALIKRAHENLLLDIKYTFVQYNNFIKTFENTIIWSHKFNYISSYDFYEFLYQNYKAILLNCVLQSKDATMFNYNMLDAWKYDFINSFFDYRKFIHLKLLHRKIEQYLKLYLRIYIGKIYNESIEQEQLFNELSTYYNALQQERQNFINFWEPVKLMLLNNYKNDLNKMLYVLFKQNEKRFNIILYDYIKILCCTFY